MAAAALMLLGAIVAAVTMPRRGEHCGDRSFTTMAKRRPNECRSQTLIDLRHEFLSADGPGSLARDSRTALGVTWLR
jgi:hypothetical protein